eukprot:477134-Rhodomonas_salina.1
MGECELGRQRAQGGEVDIDCSWVHLHSAAEPCGNIAHAEPCPDLLERHRDFEPRQSTRSHGRGLRSDRDGRAARDGRDGRDDVGTRGGCDCWAWSVGNKQSVVGCHTGSVHSESRRCATNEFETGALEGSRGEQHLVGFDREACLDRDRGRRRQDEVREGESWPRSKAKPERTRLQYRDRARFGFSPGLGDRRKVLRFPASNSVGVFRALPDDAAARQHRAHDLDLVCGVEALADDDER